MLKIRSYQEEETSKTDDVVNKLGIFEMRKYASFTEIEHDIYGYYSTTTVV